MRQSSTSGQPDLVFFTDRDLGRSVPAALAVGGLRVEPYSAHFGENSVEDGEWLRLVGERGWIALSHNKKIRWERDQLSDLMTYGARTFFIIGKGPHAAYSSAVLRSINKVRRLIQGQSALKMIASSFRFKPPISFLMSFTSICRDKPHQSA
ncbi:MAG TPA: hypothetical protein VHR45_25810 [Thermoanaerobaculia bacterium]|nr:hypothetical protein [Thermoanaerobaculia bacterium]